MKRAILLAGAAMLAFGGAAIAQDTAPAEAQATQQTSDQAPTDATAPAEAPAEATAPESATTSATTPTEAAVAATTPSSDPSVSPASPADSAKRQAAAATVQAGWAKYDPENKGKLTPLEFGAWVLAASGNDMTAQIEKTRTSKKADLPAVKVLNATSAEFAKADTDKDRAISPEELTAYLSA